MRVDQIDKKVTPSVKIPTPSRSKNDPPKSKNDPRGSQYFKIRVLTHNTYRKLIQSYLLR